MRSSALATSDFKKHKYLFFFSVDKVVVVAFVTQKDRGERPFWQPNVWAKRKQATCLIIEQYVHAMYAYIQSEIIEV